MGLTSIFNNAASGAFAAFTAATVMAAPVAPPPVQVPPASPPIVAEQTDHSKITAQLVHEHDTDIGFWERLSEAMVDDIDKVRKSSGLNTLEEAVHNKKQALPKREEFVSPEDIMKAVRSMSRGGGQGSNKPGG